MIGNVNERNGDLAPIEKIAHQLAAPTTSGLPSTRSESSGFLLGQYRRRALDWHLLYG
jgi:hypothetical protein